jgi:RNA polymerase sigma-70 factor (ECF subfamily)
MWTTEPPQPGPASASARWLLFFHAAGDRVVHYPFREPIVSDRPQGDVTQLLARWRTGAPDADAELIEIVHGELRRIAASYLRRERGGHTLQPTAVVNEAYIRLLPQRSISWENRAHFYGIAASMMRRVLVDHARKRHAAKRDFGADEPLSLSGVPAPAPGIDEVQVLQIHEALEALAKLDARQAEIVEMKYFAGLTIEEIAEVLQMSVSTVKRDWSTAKRFLRHHLLTGRTRGA